MKFKFPKYGDERVREGFLSKWREQYYSNEMGAGWCTEEWLA